jgi:Na+-translocating ferredoxin:NAD+ oxidoreductase RnfA subunit
MVRHIIIANFLIITPYILVVRATYGTVGVALGTVLGLALSAFIAWILYTVSRRCQRKMP